MVKYRSLNGLHPFKIQKHKPEFEDDLIAWKTGTLAIVNLLVAVSLSCVSILGQAIVSTLVRWVEQSSFCSVAGISQRRHGTSNAQKPIG